MKTLILESDPVNARSWLARFDGPKGRCDHARTEAQARLMLISGNYDRLCLRLSDGDGTGLLSVARATNPDCEVIDLATKTRRTVSGPAPAGVLRHDNAVDVVSH